MKYLLVVAAIMSVVYVSTPALAQLPHFNPGDVLHATDLNAIVDRINALSGPEGPPQIIPVDCSAGATIGHALQLANPGDIIQVTGTCSETIRILKDGITLDGQGSTTIDGGGSSQATINIDGAQRVTLQGLTVQNGNWGILIHRGAAAILIGVDARENTAEGIRIADNATVLFRGQIMSNNNGNDGIIVLRGSNAVFDRASVQLTGNGDAGLNYSSNAHGVMLSSTFDINANTTDGLRALIGSAISVIQNTVITIRHNGARGLVLSRSVAIEFRDSSLTASNNTTDGIGVFSGSSLSFQDALTPINVSGNGDRGVEVSLNATLQLQNSTMNVTSNTTDGIGVFNSASLIIQDAPTPINVSGNGDRGVEVSNTSTFNMQNSRLDTTNNASDGVGLFNNSRFQANLGSTVFSDNNTIGVNIADTSSIGVLGGTPRNTLTVQNNRSTGLQLSRASSANLGGSTTLTDNGGTGLALLGSCGGTLSGTTLVQGNSDFGISVVRGSSLVMSGTVNVLSNHDHGFLVEQMSALRLLDGTMVVDGNTNNGIAILRNSQALLRRDTGTFNLQIRNNGTEGILVQENSFVRLEATVGITNNGRDGLRAIRGSGVMALNISITGNTGNGLDVDESSAEVSGSTITGNTSPNVTAIFGARLTLNNNDVGNNTVACDSTVLRRGNDVPTATCP